MATAAIEVQQNQYARCIKASKNVCWDIDADVIRGRELDPDSKFLPDGLTRIEGLTFLTEAQKKYMSQVQGRTYANMFGLVVRSAAATRSATRRRLKR
jgi:hypothetical protein